MSSRSVAAILRCCYKRLNHPAFFVYSGQQLSIVMSDLSEWWGGLSLALKVYWGIAIPFTVFFILQLIFTFVGGDDAPDDVELGGDAALEGGVPFQFLTLKTMIAFLTIFGWAGIASIDSGLSHWWSAVIAGIAGLIMMFVIAGLAYVLSKAHVDGTMKFEKAIGQVGHVYLTIPAHRGSVGQVQVKVQGVLRTLEAITDDDKDLPNGKTVVVMRVLNDNTLLVTEK